MINYVKSTRLFICGGIAAYALGGFSLVAKSAELPVPQGTQFLEYQKSANTYTWQPVGSTTPPGSGSVSFKSNTTVSTVEPKATTTGQLPYAHKGGSGANVSITTNINRAQLGATAAGAAAAAAAAQMTPTNPYAAAAQLACVVFCVPVASLLAEWGYEKFSRDESGEVNLEVPTGEEHEKSSGYDYSMKGQDGAYPSAKSACEAYVATPPQGYELGEPYLNSYDGKCYVFVSRIGGGFGYNSELGTPIRAPSNCPEGTPIVDGVCTPNAPPITEPVPVKEVFEEKFASEPWNDDMAAIAAGVISTGIFRDGNVFSDATVAGPNAVPISETVSSWPVNVLPGTTTPAPSGYTGPTDSGTHTTTTTTTAQNTFNPGSSSSSGSSGSSGSSSGPSMTTTQKTETKTSVTNNITNNTSTSVTTNITETDDAPKEEEKDHCEKNKSTLACAELDEVQQDIPQKKIDITYEYTSLFGNGSCPADKHLTISGGQSLKVWDWQVSCDHIVGSFQPVLLICCAFAAFVIVSTGAKE